MPHRHTPVSTHTDAQTQHKPPTHLLALWFPSTRGPQVRGRRCDSEEKMVIKGTRLLYYSQSMILLRWADFEWIETDDSSNAVNDNRLCDGRLNGTKIEDRETRQVRVKCKNKAVLSMQSFCWDALNMHTEPPNLSRCRSEKLWCVVYFIGLICAHKKKKTAQRVGSSL